MLKSAIFSAFGPDVASPGDTISYSIQVKNIGDEAGYILALVRFEPASGAYIATGNWEWIGPGNSFLFYLSLTMPAQAIDVWAESYHWDSVTSSGKIDDDLLVHHVVLTGSPPRAQCLEWRGPGAAKEGDRVGFVITMVNTGGIAGWIRPELNWTEDGAAIRATCSEAWLTPGAEHTFDVPFTMPGQTIDVYIHAHHWDYDTEAWITDNIYGPETVKLTAIPPEEKPVAEIVSVAHETHARAGEAIRFQVTLRNIGEGVGYLVPVIRWNAAGEWTELTAISKEVEPGKGHIFSFDGVMPSVGIWVAIYAYHWDKAAAAWSPADDYAYFTIDLILGDWVHFQKAAVIRDALEPGSLTLQLYEWLAGLGADVPPIMFEPEFWIERTFDEAIDEINVLGHLSAETQDELTRAFNTLQVAIGKYDAWIEAEAERAGEQDASWWNKTLDAFAGVGLPIGSSLVDIIRGIVDEEKPIIPGWEDFKELVKDFLETTPPLSWVYGLSAFAWSILQDFPEEVVAFFSNPADWIFGKVDDWLNEEEG